MAVTKYPYAKGKDPKFDAWKAGADYDRYAAWQDAANRQRRATEDYQNALKSFDQQAKTGARTIDNNMLARGVFSSGETSRRQAELSAAILQGKEAAAAKKADVFGRTASDLQRALARMDLEQEAQVQASLGRQRGGGADSGSSRPVQPQYVPPGRPPVRPQPRPVNPVVYQANYWGGPRQPAMRPGGGRTVV